jgi:hypothetical protein
MQDISGYGIKVTLRASTTLPAPVTFTQFADDADPVDIPSQQIADKAMGTNGDMVSWGKANPILMTMNLIPGTDDDKTMAVVAEANRPARGKRPARDVITAVITYPDGSVVTLTNGKLTDAPLASGVASTGRQKSKAYQFAFENRVGV